MNRMPESRGAQMPMPTLGTFTPTLPSIGTTPPVVTVTEFAFINASLVVNVTGIGILGVALVTIIVNGVPSVGILTGASVNIPGTTAVLHFSVGTYFGDTVYTGVI